MPLAYRTWGLRENPPLVLVHGFLGDSNDWTQLANCLEKDAYIIAVDLPGHGKSAELKPDINKPWRFFSEQLNQVLQQLNIEQYTLLGYSLGGRLSIAHTFHDPRPVKQLIIESAHPGLQSAQQKQGRLIHDTQWAERFRHEPLGNVLEDWYQQPVFRPLSTPQRISMINARLGQSGETLAQIMGTFSLARQEDYNQRFCTLTVPVHFICGEHDQKFKTIGQHLTLSDDLADLHVIPAAGHNCHREKPDQTATVIKQLLRS
ncbi:2-succinyl-6-hydroxy-2,4-cyclohexadiene-1-carboxylate synthase [invertebrate metagenome]|uniref:2-succinyl-6-hydroxy-2, 4-cyclohexadiene-1-carboxylate synthase n=1 Tax=invertebrate metagenome TaxID=1711999 RepID=A0A2H9TAP0_9ZZZZ